jgi:hypothetical protein
MNAKISYSNFHELLREDGHRVNHNIVLINSIRMIQSPEIRREFAGSYSK